jgi:hypothetical protein
LDAYHSEDAAYVNNINEQILHLQEQQHDGKASMSQQHTLSHSIDKNFINMVQDKENTNLS